MQNEGHVTHYRITVEGNLHERWADWFNRMQITREDGLFNIPVTVLQGPVSDQPALRGILIKLWDLNLTLVAVERIDPSHYKEKDHE